MPDMVNVRKARAGTDSAGYTWPTDDAVIAIPVEHALVLTRIPDGGFAIIEEPAPTDSVETEMAASPAKQAVRQANSRTGRAETDGAAS